MLGFELEVALTPCAGNRVCIGAKTFEAEEVVRVVFEEEKVVFADNGKNGTLAVIRGGCAGRIGASRCSVEEFGEWVGGGGRGATPVGQESVKRGRFDALRVGGRLKELCFVRDEARKDATSMILSTMRALTC